MVPSMLILVQRKRKKEKGIRKSDELVNLRTTPVQLRLSISNNRERQISESDDDRPPAKIVCLEY